MSRYKIRLSSEPIFWTTNSINHPSKNLWTNTYLPTFVEIATTPINWIDVFTITSVLDKSDYTMLELTDTVTNEIIYFLANKITKKLTTGFEIQFTIDIYLTFGMAFMDWLVEKKLPIKVNRFLNNNILVEWFKQNKFLQQDNLLDFKNGTTIIFEQSPFTPMKCVQYDFNEFQSGTFSVKNTYNNDPFPNNKDCPILLPNTVNVDYLCPLFHVVENNDGSYFCFAQFTTDSTKNLTVQSGSIVIPVGNYKVDLNSIQTITTSDFWNPKYVGAFVVPCWKHIANWFVITGGSVNLIGFTISRNGFNELNEIKALDENNNQTDYNNSQIVIIGQWNSDNNNNIQALDNNFDIVNNNVFYNANETDLIKQNLTNDDKIRTGWSGTYLVNFYFLSQMRFKNSTIQMCPINGYYWQFQNAYLEFDGNQFNIFKLYPNTSTNSEAYWGTINVAIDTYKTYVAETKPMFNTSLQIMKSNNQIASTKNTMDSVFNGISSLGSAISNGASGNWSGAVSNILGIGKTIGDAVLYQQQLDQNYTNLQKQQDAQKASAFISSQPTNLGAVGTMDDIEQKLLTIPKNIPEYYNNNMTSYKIVNFISNFNDLKFINNLIWKNGIIGNMFISAENCFTDKTLINPNTNQSVNSFCYIDFEIDDYYIRLFSPNMPTAYIDGLKQVLIKNSIRIWDTKMDIDNMPNYYIDFINAAKSAMNSLN